MARIKGYGVLELYMLYKLKLRTCVENWGLDEKRWLCSFVIHLDHPIVTDPQTRAFFLCRYEGRNLSNVKGLLPQKLIEAFKTQSLYDCFDLRLICSDDIRPGAVAGNLCDIEITIYFNQRVANPERLLQAFVRKLNKWLAQVS